MSDEHEDLRQQQRMRVAVEKMDKEFAVMSTKFEGFKESIERQLDNIQREFRDSNAKYASKEEVTSLEKEVRDLKNSLSWFVKAVLSIVIMAVLGVAFAKSGGGLPHP